MGARPFGVEAWLALRTHGAALSGAVLTGRARNTTLVAASALGRQVCAVGARLRGGDAGGAVVADRTATRKRQACVANTYVTGCCVSVQYSNAKLHSPRATARTKSGVGDVAHKPGSAVVGAAAEGWHRHFPRGGHPCAWHTRPVYRCGGKHGRRTFVRHECRIGKRCSRTVRLVLHRDWRLIVLESRGQDVEGGVVQPDSCAQLSTIVDSADRLERQVAAVDRQCT